MADQWERREVAVEEIETLVETAPRPSVTAPPPARPLSRLYQRARNVLSEDRWRRVPTIEVMPNAEPLPRRFPVGKVSFLVCVVLPSLVAAAYFAFVAADQYVAEMRLVVRLGPQDQAAGGQSVAAMISAATSGGGGGAAAGTTVENAHIITSYIHSRSIVDDVLKTVDLRQVFTRPEADIYARLKADASIDELRDYWAEMVGTNIDAMSGIVTVQVRAFRPDDAVLLVRTIQALSETLVNTISTRARQDAIRRVSEEVQRSQGLMLAAIGEVERYRNEVGVIDPVQTATETGKLLSKVLADQLTTESQLFVARGSLSADSPTVKVLMPRIAALKQQAADLRAQLTGNNGESRNLAALLARYEEVAIKQRMAETLYTLAVGALDKARATAEAQSVYLSVFVPPGVPEDYTYPKRIQLSILVAVACLILWSIAALIVESVEDHRLG